MRALELANLKTDSSHNGANGSHSQNDIEFPKMSLSHPKKESTSPNADADEAFLVCHSVKVIN